MEQNNEPLNQKLFFEDLKSFCDFYDELYSILFKLNGMLNRKDLNDIEIYADKIFTKMLLDMSVLKQLLPKFTGEQEIYNSTTVCSLSRIIMESIYLLFYLCFEEVSKDDSDFRVMLYEYHGEKQRLRGGRRLETKKIISMKTPQEHEDLEEEKSKLASEIEAKKEKIEQSSFFRNKGFVTDKSLLLDFKNLESLPKDKQSKVSKKIKNIEDSILKGRVSKYLNEEQIAERFDKFKEMYTVYMHNSAHIHTYLFCLIQIENQGIDFNYGLNTMINSLKMTSVQLVSIAREYIKFFKQKAPNLDKKEVAFLNLDTLPKRKSQYKYPGK